MEINRTQLTPKGDKPDLRGDSDDKDGSKNRLRRIKTEGSSSSPRTAKLAAARAVAITKDKESKERDAPLSPSSSERGGGDSDADTSSPVRRRMTASAADISAHMKLATFLYRVAKNPQNDKPYWVSSWVELRSKTLFFFDGYNVVCRPVLLTFGLLLISFP